MALSAAGLASGLAGADSAAGLASGLAGADSVAGLASGLAGADSAAGLASGLAGADSSALAVDSLGEIVVAPEAFSFDTSDAFPAGAGSTAFSSTVADGSATGLTATCRPAMLASSFLLLATSCAWTCATSSAVAVWLDKAVKAC